MSNKILPYLIAASALTVSASAAFYSVSGLSKLFAGAAFAVIIMAASLEVAKLVIASLLYQYRTTLPRLLKYYLSVACFVLILITSMGIYGFLSAAYQETAALGQNVDRQIELVETRRNNVQNQLNGYNSEKESIDRAVQDLRTGLSTNKIQYRDRETGEIITTTSSSTRRALEKQLDQAIVRQTELNSKVDILNQQLFDYDTEILDIKNQANIAGELGPLKYLSNLTGKSMDTIINWLLLVIIFVFDPLAISLVIAANFAFAQLKIKYDEPNDNLKQAYTRYKQEMYEDSNAGPPLPEEPADEDSEDEWDEDHAHDMALNAAIDTLDDNDLDWLNEQIEKQEKQEDIYRDKKRTLDNRNSYWT